MISQKDPGYNSNTHRSHRCPGCWVVAAVREGLGGAAVPRQGTGPQRARYHGSEDGRGDGEANNKGSQVWSLLKNGSRMASIVGIIFCDLLSVFGVFCDTVFFQRTVEIPSYSSGGPCELSMNVPKMFGAHFV